MPAQATANSVIASAKRLIELRQPCLSSSRIAEISVPAWPIPIHQTKFTMAKPQPTGMLMPQMPTPRKNRYAAANISRLSRPKKKTKPPSQPSVTGRRSTSETILSVIVSSVWPGRRTGDCPGRSRSSVVAEALLSGTCAMILYDSNSGFGLRTAAR